VIVAASDARGGRTSWPPGKGGRTDWCGEQRGGRPEFSAFGDPRRGRLARGTQGVQQEDRFKAVGICVDEVQRETGLECDGRHGLSHRQDGAERDSERGQALIRGP